MAIGMAAKMAVDKGKSKASSPEGQKAKEMSKEAAKSVLSGGIQLPSMRGHAFRADIANALLKRQSQKSTESA